MPPSDVVVTGIGMVTPLGADSRSTVEGWRSGRSVAFRTVPELAGTAAETVRVATLPTLDPAERLGGRRMVKYLSEAGVLGCVAAREAMDESGARSRVRPECIGLFAGTGLASTSIEEVLPVIEASLDERGRFSCRLFGERGLAATNPLLSFKILSNMAPCIVSMLEGVRGPSLIFTPSQGQAAGALCEAWQAVATGEVECALTGAADDPTNPATVVHLMQAGDLAAGDALAAAAAYLVFERAETAERDGREPQAIVRSLDLEDGRDGCPDAIAERIGRCCAASPAVALALACLTGESRLRFDTADGRRIVARLEAA
ncbi:MAG: beta-ketoacyl synthase N-terminal-like domain-containing protein [Planctomycetota bacterium]|jgi:3-oxoacyl-[acyl-carrier-protein] synthase II